MAKRVLDWQYDAVFEPWPAARLQQMVADVRAAVASDTLATCLEREEIQEFKRLHPTLFGLLVQNVARHKPLIDSLLETRGKMQAGEVSHTQGEATLFDAVLKHCGAGK